MSDKDEIKDALEAFAEAEEAEAENRQNALEDIRFARLACQWADKEVEKRNREGRPCLTVNKLPQFIRQVVNSSRQNRPAINTKPVDGGSDIQTSRIYDGLIRNIEHVSDADVAYDTAVEAAVSGGFGYFGLDIDYAFDDTFDLDIRFRRFPNPFSVYGDPTSTAADSADWNVAFVIEELKRTVFERKYPDANPGSWEMGDGVNGWLSEEMVRIAEYWYRREVSRMIVQLTDGQIIDAEQYQANKGLFDAMGLTVRGERPVKSYEVKQCLLTAGEVLEKNDWVGKYIPIVPVYGEEVNEEGKRRFLSLIRHAKDPQRMHNYWRTTSTELVALAPRAPFIGPKGFAKSDPRWDTANTESHPFLEYDGPTAPQRQPLDAGPAAGAMQEAIMAADDMKAVLGMYDPSIGLRSKTVRSGVAIRQEREEGDTGTFHFNDNLVRGIRHGGRICIDLIPKVYTGERMIRVLGEDRKKSQAVQLGPEVQKDDKGIISVFNLGVGKYDLAVDAGPGYTTKREEAAYSMTEFVRAYPNAAPLMGDIIAETQDWPQSEEIGRRMKMALPPHMRGEGPPPEVMQMQQQMQEMGQQMQQLSTENQALKADVEGKRIDAQLKAKELDIKAHEVGMKSREFELKEGEMHLKGAEMQMNAQVQGEQQTELKQITDHLGQLTQAMNKQAEMLGQQVEAIGQVLQTLQQIPKAVASMQPKTRTKRGRVTRMPDGSYDLESVEEALEQ